MGRFKVIAGGAEERKSLKPTAEQYHAAIQRLLGSGPNLGRDGLKRLIFLYVRYFAKRGGDNAGCTYEEMNNRLRIMMTVTDMMAILTPAEFMRLFPIPKEYDGERYQTKDYFYGMEQVSEYPQDEPIGDDRITEFCMEYYNWDIIRFEVEMLCLISDMRKLDGQMGIMEEFCAENNIPTYSFYKEEGIMVERQTGKAQKVCKPKIRWPKHLKVIIGGRK